MMKNLRPSSVLFLLVAVFQGVSFIGAPPVDKKTTTLSPEEVKEEQWYGVEYEKYLREIVQTLEKDDEFRKKIETANPDDIKSGKIAEELDYLNDTIRTLLDEIKRNEIERLRQARHDLDTGIDHVDHTNLDTFEIEDLKKLIVKATKDLDEIDAKRKEEYKQYELDKEYRRRQKLKTMTPEEREKAELEYRKQQKKHQEHPEVKHPGSEDQLKEVWEKADDLDPKAFDLKTFFELHDLNNDGYLDFQETEALFNQELDKVYNGSNPEDDMRQREEDKNRMREHMMKELDKNKDGLLSREEILENANEPDYKKDAGWKTVDEQSAYTEDEYKEYEKKRQAEEAQAHPPAHSPLGDPHPSVQGHPPGSPAQAPASQGQPPQGVPPAAQGQQAPQGHPDVGQGHPQQAAVNLQRP